MGTRMAAQGNVASFFSLSRAIKSVAMATGGLTAALGIIGMLLAVGMVLWQKYKQRQDEAGKSAEEATEKLAAAQQRLHAVIMATKAPSYEPQVKGLQAIANAYSEAEEAAKNYKDTQDQVAAAQVATKIAGIQEAAQREIGGAAGDEDKQAEIALNVKRAAAGIQYEDEHAAIERNAAAQEDHIARIKEQLTGLMMQDIATSGMFSTPLKKAEEEITRIRTQQVATTRAGGEISPESRDALAKAISERDKLKAESEKIRTQIAKQIRDAQAAKSAAEQSLAATPEKKKQLAAEFSATEATDFAAEAIRVEQNEKKLADIRARATAETAKTKVQETARERDADIEAEIAITKIESERADVQSARLRARILSPAAARTQDKEEREAKKEEDRIEKRIKFAEEQQKRGGRGKWIEDILTFKGARAEAAAKKAELNQLEIDAASAALQSRDALQKIAKDLIATLQSAA